MRSIAYGLAFGLALFVGQHRAVAADAPALLDGAPVDAGTVLHAEGTHELVLPDGVRVTLQDATGTLGHAMYLPAEIGDKSCRGYQLAMSKGSATVHVPNDPSKHIAFMVNAGGGSFLVWRGTTHVVALEGETHAGNYDGAIYVGANNRWSRVAAGTSITVRPKGAPDSHATLLAAPTWTGGAESGLAFVGAGEKATTHLAWNESRDAQGYRVEIGANEAMTDRVVRLETTAQAIDARLSAGSYFARVSAMGRDGMPSFPSAARRIHIVGAELPPGAFVAKDGVIVVPSSKGVSITNPADLQIATAGGDVLANVLRVLPSQPFFPAWSTLLLGKEKARAFRVRDVASQLEGRIVITRRQLRADVAVSPPHARWPETPLDVQVRLSDPSGHIDASEESVTLAVRIDAVLVPVPWTREGAVSRTRIVPSSVPGTTHGPWLVSVVATDSSGAEIGSTILEVDGPRAAQTAALSGN